MRIQSLSRWMICLLCLAIIAPYTMADSPGRAPDIVYFPKDSPSNFQGYRPNELLLHSQQNPISAEARQFLKGIGGHVLRTSAHHGWLRVSFSEEAIRQAKGNTQETRLASLRQRCLASGFFDRGERNPVARGFAAPNDPYWHLQWNFHEPENGGINLERAWEISKGAGATVAILDTGLAYENYQSFRVASDLANTHVVPGYDFVNDDDHPDDDHGHGTHVAGTIAQNTDNGLGVAGIAPDATLMPVKVLDSEANGDYFTISEGIYYAVDHGADVINLSLGGPWNAEVLQAAVRYAVNRGVTVVAAAGNEYESGNPTIYPAAYDEVVAVGASTYERKRAHYSSTGAHIDLVAPGGDTRVDRNRDGYGDGILQQTISRSSHRSLFYYSEGTSMAAPHVAGIAALLVANGVRDPDAIREALVQTAQDIERTGWDSETGAGLVDAYAALTYKVAREGPDIELAEIQVAGQVLVNTNIPVALEIQGRNLPGGGTLVEVQLDDEQTSRAPTIQRAWISEATPLTLQMNWSAPAPGSYTITATLSSMPDERNEDNNHASVTVEVLADQSSRQGTSLFATIQQRSVIEQDYWEVLLDVSVQDEYDQPVSGAQVVIDWSYDSKIERTTALSDSDGRAQIRSGRLPRWASPTYYKRAVIKEGYQFAGFRTSSAQSTLVDAGVPVRAPDPFQVGPNYPNPFNPETWIPFMLRETASVQVEIRDMRGRLVRLLDLGTLSAGRYDSQGRAAYWDGRNASGDPVSSGVYFYTLRAGPYHASRKMVVRR